MRDSVASSPPKSVCRRSQELRTSRESLRTVLESPFHLDPYKIQMKQKLTEADKEKRGAMFECVCNQIENNENFLEDVRFSNEVYFFALWLCE